VSTANVFVSLHCDSFVPLVTLGVNVRQLEFEFEHAVGMLIELMAGKAAAVKACCYDATPFTYTEDDDPITYFGQCLRKGPLAHMS